MLKTGCWRGPDRRLLAVGIILLFGLSLAYGQAVDPHAEHDHSSGNPSDPFFTDLMKVYTPRQVCMYYEAPVIWLHVIADLLTAIAYYSIAVLLGYFVRRRTDLAFSWMFWLFSAFILACGTTHLFGVIDIWRPFYKVDGLVKLVTAILSVGTAVALWPLIPHALAMPGPGQLAATIEQRTAELAHTNQALRSALGAAQEARGVAEEANKAKDHFLAVLSHELRTPLTPVLATVSMLQQRESFDADTLEHLEMVRRNVEMEARLIDDLLDVTRIAQGKVELDRRPVDLCTIIQRTAEVCLPDIEARELHFDIDWGERPHLVDADVARLQQVFWNLLKNAVKFTPLGGYVGVRCRRQGESVLVEVSDSGVGIEADVMPRLFKPFEQGERGTTRQFGGLGLGLTISKALVEIHGGSITAYSAGKGKGAIFKVLLPLASEPASALGPTPEADRTGAAAESRSLHILFVEDHGDTSRIMKELLKKKGHEVQTAADVATALSLAKSRKFDLLISDLGLPDGSGWDLMQELVASGHGLPAIAISGYGMAADVQKSHEAGFAEHLTKPLNVNSLLAAVNRVGKRSDDASRPA